MPEAVGAIAPEEIAEEERLMAELELTGVRYLSRQSAYQAPQVRAPADLLAGLIRQPSARVRAAAIAVLLAQPAYGEAARAALLQLAPPQQMTLRVFYAAAVLLQQEHGAALRRFLGDRWRPLPDLFSAELGLPLADSPSERLAALGRLHAGLTAMAVNWAGTYANVADRLLRRWELEQRWSR